MHWVVPLLANRMKQVVGNAACGAMSTAARDSAQWLVGGSEAVDAFSNECLRPDAPLSTVWQREAGSSCGVSGSASLDEYLDALWHSAVPLQDWATG